jgi:anti-sigma factor RsiW
MTTATGPMNTPEYDCTLLGAYALGALEPDEERVVEEHVAICDECFYELTVLLRLKNHLRQVPPEAFLRGAPEGNDS